MFICNYSPKRKTVKEKHLYKYENRFEKLLSCISHKLAEQKEKLRKINVGYNCRT